jgi:hypothetical protein
MQSITISAELIHCAAELARRIDETAKFVNIDNLALSPQADSHRCRGPDRLSAGGQYAKLRLVADTARGLGTCELTIPVRLTGPGRNGE